MDIIVAVAIVVATVGTIVGAAAIAAMEGITACVVKQGLAVFIAVTARVQNAWLTWRPIWPI
ncbi:MAG: hypothetical protein ACP5R2_05045 [Anaerolineae bacterium]